MKDFEGERDQYQSSVLTLTSMMAIFLGCIYFLIPNSWNRITGLPSALMILMLVVFFFAQAQDFWLLRQRYEYKYKLAGALTMGSALASTVLSVIVVLSLNKANSDQIVVGRLYATNIVSIAISAILWIKLYVKGKTIVNIKY
ncbi:polysaccharide biosynthesis protein, partial [Lactococcus lactis]